MSEWLKEHAWKLNPAALSNAHRNAPTHSQSTTFRNNDALRGVPVSHGVCPRFRGWSDTVLTQDPASVIASCASETSSEELEPEAGPSNAGPTSAAILRLPAVVNARTVSSSGRRVGCIKLNARVGGPRTVAGIIVENRD